MTQPAFTRENAVIQHIENIPNHMRAGKVFTNQYRITWLNNDLSLTTTYGCRLCGGQYNTQQMLGIHIGKVHNGTKGKRDKAKVSSDPIADLQLAIDSIKAERDMWKRKAKQYERLLRSLGKVFQQD
jgi:hypothetical protein